MTTASPRKRPPSPSPFPLRAVSPLPPTGTLTAPTGKPDSRKKAKRSSKLLSRSSGHTHGRQRRRSSSDSLLASPPSVAAAAVTSTGSVLDLDSLFSSHTDAAALLPTPTANGSDAAIVSLPPPLSPRTGVFRPGPAVAPPAPQVPTKALFQDFERTIQDIGNLLKRTVPASLRNCDSDDDAEDSQQQETAEVAGEQSLATR